MIAHDSASYPVLGAADATGVPYADAFAYLAALQADDGERLTSLSRELSERYGACASGELATLLLVAVMDGRIAGGLVR